MKYFVSTVMLLVPTWAHAQGYGHLKPLDAIENYAFILPAIDCYRTSHVRITTNDTALQSLLNTAFSRLDEADTPAIKKAMAKGAKRFDKMIAERGKDTYCKFVRDRFGPTGSIARNLVKSKG